MLLCFVKKIWKSRKRIKNKNYLSPHYAHYAQICKWSKTTRRCRPSQWWSSCTGAASSPAVDQGSCMGPSFLWTVRWPRWVIGILRSGFGKWINLEILGWKSFDPGGSGVPQLPAFRAWRTLPSWWEGARQPDDERPGESLSFISITWLQKTNPTKRFQVKANQLPQY